jgi:uncharacterized protein YjeT (DUF2065 family)
MDLIAAVALMLILEGLALAVFARSVPALLAEMERLDPSALRRAGVVSIVIGTVIYLLVRGGPGG